MSVTSEELALDIQSFDDQVLTPPPGQHRPGDHHRMKTNTVQVAGITPAGFEVGIKPEVLIEAGRLLDIRKGASLPAARGHRPDHQG